MYSGIDYEELHNIVLLEFLISLTKSVSYLEDIMHTRIQQLWDEFQKGKSIQDKGWWFDCQGMRSEYTISKPVVGHSNDSVFQIYEQQEKTRIFCHRLMKLAVGYGRDSFDSLDNALSELVKCGLDTTEKEGVISCERAQKILERLPVLPQSLENLHPEFFQR